MESTADHISCTLELEGGVLFLVLHIPFYVIAHMVILGSSVYSCTVQQIVSMGREVMLRKILLVLVISFQMNPAIWS